jgi:hypothetical protein
MFIFKKSGFLLIVLYSSTLLLARLSPFNNIIRSTVHVFIISYIHVEYITVILLAKNIFVIRTDQPSGVFQMYHTRI